MLNNFAAATYVFIMLFICACKSDNENIQVLLDLPVDSEYDFVHETETNGSLISLKLHKEFSFKVKSLHNNIYYLQADLVKLTSETVINGESEIYSSSQAASNMSEAEQKVHTQYKPMLESTFNISVDKYGNVVKPFSYANGVLAPQGFFDFNLFQIIFPFKKISTKSRWESQRKNPASNTPINVKYELKYIDDNKLYISANHVIPSVQELLNSNTLYGDYIIDKNNGMLMEAKLKMNLQTGGSVVNTFTRQQTIN